MKIEILGKFYDNQSLSIINRNLAVGLSVTNDVNILPLDSPDVSFKVDSKLAYSESTLSFMLIT